MLTAEQINENTISKRICMKQTLTTQQIDELFAFCRRHYVQYYDVQTELVDHLANAIEEKMQHNNRLSFERALDEVYAGFGYKGFAGVVEAKMNAINKQSQRMRWYYFWSYFTWPKAAFTLCLCALAFLIHSVCSAEVLKWILLVFPLSYLIFETFLVIKYYRQSKKIKRKLVLTGVLYTFPGVSLMYFNIVFNFFNSNLKIWNQHPELITDLAYYSCAITFILLVLLSLACLSVTENLLAKALKEYPLAFIA